jgi:hypothetical protein
MLERLAGLSQPFGTVIDIHGDTAEIKLPGKN